MNALATIALLIGLTAAGHAAAHGDAAHKPKSNAASEPVKEQKDWGIAGDSKAVQRTIHIAMSDRMRFTPDRITVRQGETVRMVFRNQGRQLHEFVLGTRQELEAHAALMLKFPDMEHDEPYMAHVPPGRTAQIIWTFNRAGRFDFGCLIPGHFQAGMVGQVQVQPDPRLATESSSPAADAKPGAPTGRMAAGELSEGVIRKVDAASRTLLIRHGDIPSLGMGPMTMVFNVSQPGLLKGLKAGDSVRFAAEHRGDNYVVTEIRVMP